MTRPDLDYTAPQPGQVATSGGIDVTTPVAGFYLCRLVKGGIRGAVRLYYGPPLDPVTGEELDRSWRWMADFNGEPLPFDRVWPGCAGDPISEAEYQFYCQRQSWARDHAPDSAHAEPGRKHDPLSPNTPLPF